eukprot:3206060-Karenia_brevis.AAC.1
MMMTMMTMMMMMMMMMMILAQTSGRHDSDMAATRLSAHMHGNPEENWKDPGRKPGRACFVDMDMIV